MYYEKCHINVSIRHANNSTRKLRNALVEKTTQLEVAHAAHECEEFTFHAIIDTLKYNIAC